MSESNNIKEIHRDQYKICIREDLKDGLYVEITVLPSNYKLKTANNFILLGIINTSIYYLINYSQTIDLHGYDVSIQLILFLVTLFLIRSPQVEQVTVIKDYGIQLTKWDGFVILPYAINKRLTQQREFISREKILDVIINEGFYKWYQVIFYLCIMVRNERKLKLMFHYYIKMKLEDEKLIYRLCQRYLYTEEDKRKHDCLH